MSLSLAIGTAAPLALDKLTDLKSDASSLFQLGKELAPFLGQPLSKLPANLRTTAIQYSSGNQSWTPGAISFNLSGSVCGTLSVITSGTLLSYTDGFPTTVTLGAPTAASDNTAAVITVTAPSVYVCLELDFKLSGGVSGSYSSGAYGVSTDNSASASISVAFYKHCTAATSLQDAITSAFAGFVLPLHPNTLKHLTPGDYLHYVFNGSLQLGLGASVGFDKVLYAGQFKSDIPKTSGALSIAASASPEVQAGAKLAFSYDYTGTFEILLWLDTPATAHLHLFRSSTQDTTLGLNLGLNLSANAAVSGSITPDQLEAAMTKRLPGLAQSTFQTKVLDPANAEISKYVTEVDTRISGWLKRVNDQKASLDLAIEATRDRFLLTNYSIDLSKAYQASWDAMVGGRFLDAFNVIGSGVTLDTGSGLESVFTSATSIKLNLFGALNATWTDTLINNTSLLYAGNNVFHLISNQGRELLTQINGGKKEIDIYFAVEADLSRDQAPLIGANVDLHIVLQATANPGFGGYIAGVVGQLTQGTAGRALAATVQALATQPNTTELLHLIFPSATYSKKLQASKLSRNKPFDESADQANYTAFARACAQLFGNNSPANFSYGSTALGYPLWRGSNIAANDSQPTDASLPNRMQTGSYYNAISYLNAHGLSSVSQLAWYAINAGQDFMNLCADLQSLAAITATTNLSTWQDLVAKLQSIIKNDVGVDFIPPTALALANLCGGAPATVSGPTPSLPTGTSIGITMTY